MTLPPSGPVQPGLPPIPPQGSFDPAVSVGVSGTRTVIGLDQLTPYLSDDLGTLLNQVSRRYNERTAKALTTMNLFAGRKLQPLSVEEQVRVMKLAEFVHGAQTRGETEQSVKSLADRQWSVSGESVDSVSGDSGLGNSESDSVFGDRQSELSRRSSTDSVFGRTKSWDGRDELAFQRYEQLRNHPFMHLLDQQLDGNLKVIHQLLRSEQADPMIEKLVLGEELTPHETSALLAQADHLVAIVKRNSLASLSSMTSAEAAMPFSSEVDITDSEVTREMLTRLGENLKNVGTDRQRRLEKMAEQGDKALGYAEYRDKKRRSTKDGVHLSASRMRETNFTKEREDFLAFRALVTSDPELRKEFDELDFLNLEKMRSILSSVSQEIKLWDTKNKQLEDELKAMDKYLSDWEESDSYKDLGKLCKSLRRLADLAADPNLRETLGLFADHLTDKVFTHIRNEFEADLRQKFRDLEKGGSSREITVSVGLGAGLAAYGIEGLSIDFGLEYTFKVTGNDDTRIREFHIVKTTGKLTGGDEKVLSGSFTAGLTGAKGRVFRNLDDFIRFHSNDLVPLLIGKAEDAICSGVGAIKTRKQRAYRHKAVANSELLTLRLQEQGALLASQRVKAEAQRKPNYAEFTQRKGSLKAGLAALSGMLDASLTFTNTVTDFKTRTDLLQTLKNNPEKFRARNKSFISFWVPASQEELNGPLCKLWNNEPGREDGKKVKHISELPRDALEELKVQLAAGKDYKFDRAGVLQKRVSGDTGIGWIKYQQRRLQDESLSKAERIEIREQCKQAILDQYAERDLYYYTLNAMDGYIGAQSGQKDRLAKVEKSFRQTVGARNRGEFIEAHTYTFFRLWMTYMMSFNKDENPAVDDALFFMPMEQFIEPTLTRPQVNLSDDKDIREHLRVPSTATSKAVSVDADFTVSVPGTSIKGGIHSTYTRTVQNTNPDNDGEYINLSFTLGAGGHLGRAIQAVGDTVKQKNLDGSKGEGVRAELFLAMADLDDFDLTAEAEVKLEVCLVHRDRELYRPDDQEKDWHLQYVRVTGSRSLGAKTPNIGIPTGPVGELKLSFGAKVGGANNWFERPGNNTLTYAYTKYNGWRSGNKVGGEGCYWNAYVNQNKKYFREMLVYMGRKEKNAFEEMNETFKRIETILPEMKDKCSPAEFTVFKKDFMARLTLFSACTRLEKLAKKKTPSDSDMSKAYRKIKKNWPGIESRMSEQEFVKLKDKLIDGNSEVLEQALKIDRTRDKLNFEPDMLESLEQFLDLQHEAYLRVARGRYSPSFKKLRIV